MRIGGRLTSRVLLVSVCVLCSSNFARALVRWSPFDEMERLYEEFDKNFSVFEVKCSPRGNGIRLDAEVDGENINEFLLVDADFEVRPSVIRNRLAISGGHISERVPVRTAHGGDERLRRVYPLLPSSVARDMKKCFLLACGRGEGKELLDLSFYGPFLDSECKSIREMIQALARAKSDAPGARIEPRKVLLPSDNMWIALLGLVILKQQGEITAFDFLSNPRLHPIEDMGVLNGLFYEAYVTKGAVKQSLPDAMLLLIRNKDTEYVRMIMARTIDCVKIGICDADRLLSDDRALLQNLERTAASREPTSPELVEDIRRLRNVIALRESARRTKPSNAVVPERDKAGDAPQGETRGLEIF